MRPVATVIVASDRCANGIETDTSGEFLVRSLRDCGFSCASATIIHDDESKIRAALADALDQGARLIVTSGGTGIGPRDITPEATAPFIHRPLPALAQLITAASLEQTPLAALSRGLVGLTKDSPKTLIINAPGSLRAVECVVTTVIPLLPHLFSQLDGTGDSAGSYRPHEMSVTEVVD